MGPIPPSGRRIGSGTWIVAIGGLLVPLVVLVALFVVTVAALPATSPGGQTQMTIDVAARQWFWSIDYPGVTEVRTANEIHIPVGVPVLVECCEPRCDSQPLGTGVEPEDRCHPGAGQRGRLAGKPGRASFVVNVPSTAASSTPGWRCTSSRSRGPRSRRGCRPKQSPAPQPSTAYLERGQQIFLGSACEYCHTIAGTNATGTVGPDLTHIGSRLSIGAGTLPNNEGNLAGWILDPQHFKPENKMPATALSGAELQPLARLPREPALIAEAPASGSSSGRGLSPGGCGSALKTVDHKRIGIRYLVTASVFFALGGV